MRKSLLNFNRIFTTIAIVFFIAIFLTISQTSFAATGILKQINFQGKVVNANGTNVTNGNYSFVFSLYTVSTGGTNIWTETKTITVTDGIFRTALGDTTTFPGSVDFNTDNIYLGINFNSDGEMTPRVQFTAVPYAFNALKVAGLTVTDTTGTFTLAAGKTLTVNNTLTLAGTDATTITFQGTDTYVGRATTDTLTNKTIGSTGLTFSGAATDITTASNEDFTLTPNGSGNTIITSDFNSGVLIGSSANTLAPLSVSGGIGSNALLILNQTNSGDLLTASASGTTKFRIANNGDVILSAAVNVGGTNGTSGQCLLGGANAAWGSCAAGAGSNWDIVNGIITPKFTSTLDFLLGSTATGSAKFAVLNINSGTPTASIAGNLTFDSVGVIQSTKNQTLTIGGNTTGNIILTPNNGSSGLVTINAPITATTFNKLTLTTPATGSTLTIADGKTFTASNTLTLSGTDGSSLAIGTGGTLGTGAYATIASYALLAGPTFTGTVTIPTPFTLGAVSMTSTGTQLNYLNAATGTTGTTNTNLVFSTSPTLIAPVLGAATATSVNGLIINTTTGTLALTNAKTLTVSDSTALDTNAITLAGGEVVTFSATNALSLLTTGTTSVTLPTSGTLLTNTTAAVQTVTSTQSTGTVLGITDATALTGAIKGTVITLSGANAFDQTGLEFNLSNATGTNLNDIVGTGSTWKVSKGGALTVASCSGCGAGGGGGNNWWTIDSANGVLYPGNLTTDFLLGGTSTASAKFAVTGLNGSNNVNVDINGTLSIDTNSTSDDVFKTSTTDFTQAGSSVTPASAVTTTNNQVSLALSTTVVGPVAGPALVNGASATSSSILRPDGKVLVILGGGTTTTNTYNPLTNTFTAGPNLTAAPSGALPAGAPPGAGLLAFQRPDGKFIIIHGTVTTFTTSIYDPAGSLNFGSMSVGPAMTAQTGAGRNIIQRSDGKVLILLGGNTTTTNIYDPVNNTFVLGPLTATAVTTGSFVFQRPDGKWIVGVGGSTTLNIYDPVTNGFSVNTSVVLSASSGTGAHAFQMPDGRFMIIHGGAAATTTIYNPVLNTAVAGPAITGALVGGGANSFQLANGKFRTIVGNQSTAVYEYDPTANAFTNSANNLTAAANGGAHVFQRPDGMYVVIHGGGATSTTLYHGGWNTSGVWESENINNTKISTSSALFWSRSPQNNGNYYNATSSAQQNIQFFVKTAQNQNATAGQTSLADQNYLPIEDNGDLIQTNYNSAWVKVKVNFTVPVPAYFSGATSNVYPTNVWPGEGGAFYQRRFSQPSVFDFRIQNPLIQYGGINGQDPNFGHSFATQSAVFEGVMTDNKNQLTLAIEKNLPSATGSAGVVIASASANLGATSGAGAHAFELPDGKMMIIVGGAATTTRLYDPSNGTFSAGPTLPNAVGAGGHSFELPDGKFMMIAGNAANNTNVYDPVARLFYSGPKLNGNVGIGGHSFQRSDGKFVIVRGGSNNFIEIYDPVLNSFTTGPAFINGVTAGAGAHTIRRSDGRFLVVLGNAVAVANATQIYDQNRNAFTAGPAPFAVPNTGGFSIQRPDGKFVLFHGGAGISTTSVYDPTAATGNMTQGPNTSAGVGAGGLALQRPDGKYLIINGNNATGTTIYDPALSQAAAVVQPAGPTLPFASNTGAFAFQRQDGKYVLVMGANTAIIDTGWNLYGSYTSEPIFSPNLGASTALYWKNSNGGKMLVKYRTASTQNLLGLAAWTDAEKDGTLINPASGDVYVQVRFDFQAILGDFPGSKSRVWVGSDSGGVVVYYRQPITPILQYWKLATTAQPSALTITSNGSNLFRFTADGSAFTSKEGAWYSGGADIAEYYPSSQDLEEGEVVVIDPANKDGEYKVVRSTKAYEGAMLGIVSTHPGFVAGAYTVDDKLGKPFAIALTGRVPAKVSLMNGLIQAGDALTSSPIPGVLMKAAKAGPIVGRALESYSSMTSGTIMVFVEKGTFNGLRTEDIVSSLTAYDSTKSAYLLTQFLDQDTSGIKTDVSEIITDRIVAGIEVVTPKVVTKTLLVNTITPAIGSDVTLNLSGDGKFVIKNENEETAVSFDSKGNAFFAGTLTADKISANQIQGLEIITSQISNLKSQNDNLNFKTDELSSQIAGVATSSALANDSNKSSDLIIESARISLDMTVLGRLQSEGSLVVLGPAQFKSETIFEKLVTLLSNVIFKGKVTFEDVPTFNNDTAGFAVIKTGADRVDIIFEKEYEKTPIVSVGITLEEVKKETDETEETEGKRQEEINQKIVSSDIRYIVTKRTTKGFVVLLNRKAVDEITFSWIALSVKDSKKFESAALVLTPTPTQSPAPTITPAETVLSATSSASQ